MGFRNDPKPQAFLQRKWANTGVRTRVDGSSAGWTAEITRSREHNRCARSARHTGGGGIGARLENAKRFVGEASFDVEHHGRLVCRSNEAEWRNQL